MKNCAPFIMNIVKYFFTYKFRIVDGLVRETSCFVRSSMTTYHFLHPISTRKSSTIKFHIGSNSHDFVIER